MKWLNRIAIILVASMAVGIVGALLKADGTWTYGVLAIISWEIGKALGKKWVDEDESKDVEV